MPGAYNDPMQYRRPSGGRQPLGGSGAVGGTRRALRGKQNGGAFGAAKNFFLKALGEPYEGMRTPMQVAPPADWNPQPDDWGYGADDRTFATPETGPMQRGPLAPPSGGAEPMMPGGVVPQQGGQQRPMPQLVPGYPMPNNELHRQALLSQWNTRYRGTPAPAYLQQPDFRSEAPEDFIQRFRQQLQGRQQGGVGNTMQTGDMQAELMAGPDAALLGGVGSQRIGGPGGISEDPTQTRMRNADGSIDRHYVYGGSSAMGAPGLPQGQVRVHTMLPGGAGVDEIPTPWVKKTGQVDPQRVAESRARTLYRGGEGKDLGTVKEQAAQKRKQLQGYADARKAKVAERANAIRNAGGGVLLTDEAGNNLSNEEVVANAADRARGTQPFSQRAANATANAMDRGRARRERIENRNAVPSIDQRLAMQEPALGIAAGRNAMLEREGAAQRQAQERLMGMQNENAMGIAKLQAQQPTVPDLPMHEQYDRFVQTLAAAGITDPLQIQEAWDQRNKAIQPPGQQQAPAVPGVQQAPGAPIPAVEQSVGYGPMVSQADERALDSQLKRFETQPDRQRQVIEEYGRQNGWTPEQIRSAQQTRLGRTWSDWWNSDFNDINPNTGEYEMGFGRSMGLLGDPIREYLNSLFRDTRKGMGTAGPGAPRRVQSDSWLNDTRRYLMAPPK